MTEKLTFMHKWKNLSSRQVGNQVTILYTGTLLYGHPYSIKDSLVCPGEKLTYFL